MTAVAAATGNGKIKRRYRAVFFDMANYAMSFAYVPQIHFRIEFDGKVNVELLKRTLRLVLDAEPVLGCRFVPRWIRPYWERLDSQRLDKTELLRIVDAPDDEHGVFEAFCNEAMDELRGPQLRALLIRNEKDELIFKVNHQVADAGGTKELAYLLGDIYRNLLENPGYRPPINNASRSLSQVYKRFSISRLLRILEEYLRENYDNMVPLQTRNLKNSGDKVGPAACTIKRIDKQRVDQIRSVAVRNNATINDVIVAGLFRVLEKKCEAIPGASLRLVGTVDLRRYLPGEQAEAVCNLSNFYFLKLDHARHETFEQTLAIIKSDVDKKKAADIGLPFGFGSWLLFVPYPFSVVCKMTRSIFMTMKNKGNFAPGMTNLGPIKEEALNFGSPPIEHAETIVPISKPLFFAFGLSGFRGTLTFSAGIWNSSMPQQEVRALFDAIDSEIPIS